ncbi:CLUMA_CG013893, isoform A [Clunio marinus]|uniref:CLUMA_CG013893, isoform A n=1 Tax=Clunio marinus TaxID=568069 RepID=A0A1J1IQ52_9DIPT|nr:CLUMA_CG013893, isoform A [Clunio marinus]
MSLFSASIVIALCRRKSTRLVAVIGGLVLALGVLFASFATLLHQVALSYCIVVGFGASLVRDSSAVMIGHYFKRRRQFVEMIVMAGEGVGIALFSVILKEGVGKIGWRLGLQCVTVLVSLSFFMGLLYRPASLYHPQRRAILHLKNSRKKVKEKKSHIQTPKPPFVDFSPLRSSTVRMLCILAAIGAFGVYTPVFFLSFYGFHDGYDMQDLVLLQTFLGLSLAVGIVASGSSINKTCQIASSRKIRISRQYVCQGCVVLVSISIVIFSTLSNGYHTLCIVTWMYGLGLGGYRYSLKMLALERVRGKFFTRAWGFIKGAESIPVLISIPLTGFLNDASLTTGKAGYYICSALTAISAVLMFFIGYPKNTAKYSANGSIISRFNGTSTDCGSSIRCNNQWPQAYYPSTECAQTTPHHHHHFPPQYNQQFSAVNGSNAIHYNCRASVPPPHGRLQKSLSFAFQTPAMMNEWYHQGCQNQLNSINYPHRSYSRCDMFTPQHINAQSTPNHVNGMNSRSRSVPEGLAHPNGDINWNYNRTIGPNFYRTQPRQPIQVLEQITTSV